MGSATETSRPACAIFSGASSTTQVDTKRMEDRRTVLIAGCGYVGVALARHLCRLGFRVTGLRRETKSLPACVEPFRADLLDRTALARLPGPWDSVVYVAGASEYSAQGYRAAYVTGVENLLLALAAQGNRVRRLIFASSTGVYGRSDGSWVDEDTPVDPPPGPQRYLAEGESLVARSPFRSIALRFGGIYGPGRCSLLRRIRAGEIPETDSAAYTNRIHRDDCVGVIHHLMDLANPDSVYNAVDNEPVALGRLITWLASEMGVCLPARAEPVQPSRPGHNKRCSNARLRASGYEFRYPSFREGYGELLKDSSQG